MHTPPTCPAIEWQNNGRVGAWDCVYLTVHAYQESVLAEIPALVAAAHARAKPNGPIIAAQSVMEHLKSAVKVRPRQDAARSMLTASWRIHGRLGDLTYV